MGLHEDMVRLELRIQKAVNEVNPVDRAQQVAAVQRMLRKLVGMNERMAAEVGEAGTDADARAVAESRRRHHDDELRRLRGELRRMSVNARRLAAKQQAEERQQLLSGRAGAGDRDRGSRQRHGDPDAASMVRDAKDVTGTLKRARQMMSSQIDQLMNVTDLLENDSKTMDNTLGEHSRFRDSVGKSAAHLAKLRRRDLTDKVVIGLGVMLFACVVLYILWRRLRHVFGFLSAITYLFGGGSDAGFAADGPDLTSDGGTGTYHATEDL